MVNKLKNDTLLDIPHNWKWVKAIDVLDIEYGKGLPKTKLTPEGYPVYGANGQIGYYEEYTQEDPRVLMTCRGATCGTINISMPKSFVTSNSLIFKPKWDADIRFLAFLFTYLDKSKLISGTAQPQITIKAFEDYYIPFPPEEEQKRIGDKIEGLFIKVDKACNFVKEAKDTFELRRASILNKAFNGELTRDWRTDNIDIKSAKDLLEEIIKEKDIIYNNTLNNSILENRKKPSKPKKYNSKMVQSKMGELPESWTYCTLGDIVYDFKYGSSEKSDYQYEGTPVLRIPNIGNVWVEIADLKFLKEDLDDPNNLIKEGDILIVRSNGSKDLVGKCSIVRKGEVGYAYASYLIRIRPVKVLSAYLLWLLKSEGIKSQFFSKAKSSAGINNINTEELASTIIPLPPVEEQIEIVNIINYLIEENEKIVQNNLEDIKFDLLKHGILSRAFFGLLGTNDASEVSLI